MTIKDAKITNFMNARPGGAIFYKSHQFIDELMVYNWTVIEKTED
jgi:hypothetical protein